MKPKTLLRIALIMLLGSSACQATQTVRETWDSFIPGDRRIDLAQGSSTAVGFEPLNWVDNLQSPVLTVDNNSAVWGAPGLPGDFNNFSGSLGDIWCNAYATYPTNGLIDNHDPRSWAVRQLIPSAQINFNAAGTYYFSVQLWHGNDSNLGMGFASDTNDLAHFVGAGITRISYASGRFTNMDGSSIELGNTLYITGGTLGQVGDPLDPNYGVYPVEGPAMVLAYATNDLGFINPGTYNLAAGLLVGKLTTSAGGNATMSVAWFTNGAALPTDVSSVVWGETYSFNETSNMTHLLLWETGNDYQSAIDAVRVATTYGEVAGIESKISVSPGSTVATAQPVTFTSKAFNAPVSYQWTKDGNYITDATNASYAISSPVVGDSGLYTLIVSNAYGLSTNNPMIQLTVTAPLPPSITAPPASVTRYLGGNQTFTVAASGSEPLSYQWTHAGTNLPSATSTSLTISGVTAANAGAYQVIVSSPYPPPATSSVATLTIIAPPAGSFAAAAVANGVASLWQFSELTNDPASLTPAGLILHDYAGGMDGICPDTNVVQFGLAALPFPGFSGLTSLQTANNGAGSRVNLPVTQFSNTMTMLFWINRLDNNGAGLMLNTGGVGNGPGDGPMFGIDYRSGTLASQWGSGASMWNSGITLPQNQWSFAALVVETNETTVYAGPDPVTLEVATRSAATGTNYANTSGAINGPLGMGRTDYGWAQPGNAWAGTAAQFSDAAVFYQALSPAAITNLFLAGVGVQIKGQPDGSGNLMLNWLPGGALQAAPAVTGTYTNVPGATPPYSVPMSGNQQFFRVLR